MTRREDRPATPSGAKLSLVSQGWRFYQSQKYRVRGSIIFLAGIGTLIWTGLVSASSSPSTPELAVLLGVSGALQVWAGVTFGKVGKVDAEKAKSAVRRLLTVGFSIRDLRTELQSAIQTEEDSDLRAVASRVDQGLRDLAYHLSDAVADWTDVHSEALQSVLASSEDQQHRLEQNQR